MNLRKPKMSMNKFSADPFLCSDCRTLGYCKRRLESSSDKVEPLLTDKEISNWVPVNARKVNGSKHFYTNLQRAHDLFHQGEFEAASYLYRDLLSTRSESDEVHVGLAASLYFLFQFEEAAAVADNFSFFITNDFTFRFAMTCEKRYEMLKQTNATDEKNESDNVEIRESKPVSKINTGISCLVG